MSDMLNLLELRRAYESGGCPLCVFRDHAEQRYLWFFAHEGTNDGARLGKLMPARGFCTRHGNLFAEAVYREHGDTMGVANSYHCVALKLIMDLEALHKALSRAASRDDAERTRELIRKHLDTKEPCPACATADQSERYAISCLLEAITQEPDDQEWRDRFEKGAALCWRHLLAFLDQCEQHATVEYLVEVQLAKWKSLDAGLQEYLRKCDYRFKDEPKGAEQESWKRALEMFGK
ncbi:MAG: hypothetical protein AUJ92_21495 [Armatimonadetes bacterium CG2_30_59_28]|nr:hypothetical protein [Armatimonadota bacterium]OIO89425.1 MAG: hypothetical protein AUJ92_21495 [Armatimonadetes bacterium CG2_30_59_28]PIU64036.1 MAG: hypothetical protein COS85_14090 [Armatimonadetes bacterium CG07_land_8_20_14_0_80_59_28]PIX43881.1 MAG: hypothetical protein COZ56_06045 [Armatimonadetes bacterium CG_4_8_14_3_um_filter_58_9]PIY46923.1 MAG: hypothetical protein COZ05_05515 [Armatimonadetes bacterium CG_4_10_14_3_um_filter_59_10]